MTDSFPLTFPQESLWFFHEVEPESRVYHRGFLFRLQGVLDLGALQRSLNRIVERHTPFRTLIRVEEGLPRQVVRDFSPFELAVIDLPGVSLDDRLPRADAMLRESLQRSIDLHNGPVWEMRLLRFSEEDSFLLFWIHHIFFDGYSLTHFVRELQLCYAAFSQGAQPTLPDLPLSYGEYARAQKANAGHSLDTALDAWVARLGGEPTPLDFPTDHLRAHAANAQAHILYQPLGAELVRKLNALARETRSTVFSILLSAFGVVLQRYTGQDNLIVGCPFANRLEPEAQNLIGFFVNTMPVRVEVLPEMTFASLVRKTRDFMLFAIEHQWMPFEQLVKRLNPPRELNRHPVFQIVFNKVPIAYERVQAAALTIEKLPFDDEQDPFDMQLRFNTQGDDLLLTWKYNAALFEAETIQRVLSHFETLLVDALDDPQKLVGDLRMLSDAEQKQLIHDWNDTLAPIPSGYPHQWIQEQVRLCPEALAVVDDARSLTYHQLGETAGLLARRLQLAGVGVGARVGLLLERGVDLPVAMLAAMQCGAAYVPLDPSQPTERIRAILQDSGAGWVVTQPKVWKEHSLAGPIPIWMDHSGVEAAPAMPAPELSPQADDLVYLIYTSGSTGQPKGVQVTYGGLAHHLAAMQRITCLSPADRLLAVTTITFDISNLELLLPLTQGATVSIASSETSHLADALAQKISAVQPTWMQATPATWSMLLAAGWPGEPEMSILCGGETLPLELAAALAARTRALWNVYGPTEVTIWATAYRVQGTESRLPIGRPLANYRAYVLDARLHPVPVGAKGMLYLAGPAVARGYENRPELTAAAFLPDPFFPGERMYRTGDLAAFAADGSLLFYGRDDFQVKIRGFRIEPGEVESVLKLHPSIRDAVVVVQEHAAGRRLAAFWQGDESPSPALREFVQSRLPDYMIPAVFERLERFPLTPAGKIDRKALALRRVAAPFGQDALPASETQIRLARIWQDVLGLERVGVLDNFFDLGGHSLMAVQLFSRIEQEFSIQLPLAALFTSGTVAALAQLIDSRVAIALDVVPMRAPQGSRTPLFLFPGVGGDVLYLREPTLFLSDDQPVYGLQHGRVAISDEALSIPEMAAHFILCIKQIQPQGPYRLLGSSFGGILAYETAVQLRQNGDEVALLMMLDTVPPGVNRRMSLQERARYHAQLLAGLDWRGQLKYLSGEAQHLLARLINQKTLNKWLYRAFHPLVKRFGFLNASLGKFLPKWEQKRVRARSAYSRYDPRPYDGDLIMFRATRRDWRFPGLPLARWHDLILGKIEYIDFDCSHGEFVKQPFARQTGIELQKLLDASSRHDRSNA